jgi:hypothetical protein
MFLLLCGVTAGEGQPQDFPCRLGSEIPRLSPQGDVPEFIAFVASLVPLKVLQDEAALKAYIVSDDFLEARRRYGDLYSVDVFFDRALSLSWGNRYEALLIACAATMDHRSFGVRFPLLGPLLWVPLTSEFPDEFRRRRDALPVKLYVDTPIGRYGDKDKLQHFFGSAFLAFLCESADAAERVGNFVEWGEDRFIVDGTLDSRDIRANRQGQQFGLALLADPAARPSAHFTKENP